MTKNGQEDAVAQERAALEVNNENVAVERELSSGLKMYRAPKDICRS